MTGPQAGVCSSWIGVGDRCLPCTDEISDEEFERWMLPASNVAYNLSGRQFPGACEVDPIRPCARRIGRRGMDSTPPGWHPSWGTCGCGGPCGCAGNREIELGYYPIVEILEVKINGEVLDPSEYRVDNWRTLIRLRDADGRNPGWPTWQELDLDDDQPDTWSVTLTWGREPPPEGVRAAAVLACELAMACNPETAGECRLPKNVTSVTREGVTMVLSPSDFLDKDGKTGLWELDLFIRSVNPNRSQQNASVWAPGLGATSRRPGIGGS